MTIKRSEADVKREVLRLLKCRGLISFVMNAGSTFLSHKGKMRCIRGNPAGTADLLVFVNHPFFNTSTGRFDRFPSPLWLECKSSEGKQSPVQKQFQQMVKREGHTYLLVRSAEEVEIWLKANG